MHNLAPETHAAPAIPNAGERLSRTEITQKVRGIIAEETGKSLSELHDTTPMRSFARNAMEAVCVVINIGAAFDISLDGEDFTEETTIGELISLVEGAAKA